VPPLCVGTEDRYGCVDETSPVVLASRERDYCSHWTCRLARQRALPVSADFQWEHLHPQGGVRVVLSVPARRDTGMVRHYIAVTIRPGPRRLAGAYRVLRVCTGGCCRVQRGPQTVHAWPLVRALLRRRETHVRGIAEGAAPPTTPSVAPVSACSSRGGCASRREAAPTAYGRTAVRISCPSRTPDALLRCEKTLPGDGHTVVSTTCDRVPVCGRERETAAVGSPCRPRRGGMLSLWSCWQVAATGG